MALLVEAALPPQTGGAGVADAMSALRRRNVQGGQEHDVGPRHANLPLRSLPGGARRGLWDRTLAGHIGRAPIGRLTRRHSRSAWAACLAHRNAQSAQIDVD